MLSVSAIVTAAGKGSRMRNDQIKMNLAIKNKLILPLTSKTIIETTIENILNIKKIKECIIVLGHHSDEILPYIQNIQDSRIKIVENNPINVKLSSSLLNGLNYSNSDISLCVTGDQPTISSKTFNLILNHILNSNNPKKTISILRRKNIGKLNNAEGLGMPFAAYKSSLINYLQNENSNLNPILRKMHSEDFEFYGIKEDNPLELMNINNYSEYQFLLKKLNQKITK